MKKLIVTFVFLSIFSIGFANEAYEKAMSLSIEKLFQVKTVPEYIEVANQFERIAKNPE